MLFARCCENFPLACFFVGLERFDPVLHFDCSSLLHKWDSSRPTSPTRFVVSWVFFFFFFNLKAWDMQSQKRLKAQQTKINISEWKAPEIECLWCNRKCKNDFKLPFFSETTPQDTMEVCFDSLVTSTIWCPAAREPKLMNEIGVFWFAALFLGTALSAWAAASLTTFWQDSCSESKNGEECERTRDWNRTGLMSLASQL